MTLSPNKDDAALSAAEKNVDAAPGGPATTAFIRRWAPGHSVAGKYTIEHVIGSGAMAVVVAATHLELETRVAIKLLRPEVLDRPDLVARFGREARAAVKMKSERVARVFDVGKLDDGTPYMVMEYLEGLDLSHVLQRRGPLPIEEAVEYILQTCEALAEAHAMGIVHRDIKPANLFLARRGGDAPDAIKVLDFGISKAGLTGLAVPEISLTDTVALMGTPLYMSPEQLRDTRNVDARSDIWSLGIVLYELLTGRVAYHAESITRLTAAILEEPPPSLRAMRPDAPEGLEAVVRKCLAKSLDDRYASVGEVVRDLLPFSSARARASAERAPWLLRRSGFSLPPPSMPPAQQTGSWWNHENNRSVSEKQGRGGLPWAAYVVPALLVAGASGLFWYSKASPRRAASTSAIEAPARTAPVAPSSGVVRGPATQPLSPATSAVAVSAPAPVSPPMPAQGGARGRSGGGRGAPVNPSPASAPAKARGSDTVDLGY